MAGDPKPKPTAITIEQLRTLLMVHQEGTVSAAAKKMGKQQPVLARSLMQLDEKSGLSLLKRESRGDSRHLVLKDGRVQFTANGEELIPLIGDLIRRYDQIVAYLQEEAETPQLLKIACGGYSSERMMPKLVAAMHDRRVEVQVLRGRERLARVASGAIDLAIISYTDGQIHQALDQQGFKSASMVCEPILKQSMLLVASKNSHHGKHLESFAKSKAIPVKTLSQMELIGPDRNSGLRQRMEDHFQHRELMFVVEGGGFTSFKEYAKQGLGVAIVPDSLITPSDARSLVTRRLSRDLSLTYNAVYRKDNKVCVEQTLKWLHSQEK